MMAYDPMCTSFALLSTSRPQNPQLPLPIQSNLKRHHHVHQAHLALRPCSSPPSEVCPPSTRCWPPGPPPATPSRSPWSPPWRCLCLLGHLILQQHPHSQVSHSFPSFPGVCGSSSSAQEHEVRRCGRLRWNWLDLVVKLRCHRSSFSGDALGRAAPGFS